MWDAANRKCGTKAETVRRYYVGYRPCKQEVGWYGVDGFSLCHLWTILIQRCAQPGMNFHQEKKT